jgi:DNA repair exonuclease SbcCD ATPase subunit
MSDQLALKKVEYTVRAKQVLKRTAEDIIELSQICHEYHQEFGYQEYVRWLKDDLGMSETYGRNLLNVYKQFGFTAQCAVIPCFDSSALRLLSENSTPESARQEALDRAEQGETISYKAAHEIVDRYKAQVNDLKEKLNKAESLNKLSKDIAGEAQRYKQETEGYRQEAEALRGKLIAEQGKEPEVIEKIVEVEKEVIKTPEDYEQTKKELEKAKGELDRTKTKLRKTAEDTEYRDKRIQNLLKTIAGKETELSAYDYKKKELKATSLLDQALKNIHEAFTLFNDPKTNLESLNFQFNEQIHSIIRHIKEDVEIFENKSKVINLEACNG